jgi:hypothetical protein
MSTFTSGLYTQSAAVLQSELLSGEFLLWAGQPARKVIFHPRDVFAIPLSFMWGGFAIFWELSVTGTAGLNNSHPAPAWFALWGIPFVLFGQYMIWGRFLYTAWRKARTHYGVTNKRILVLNTAPSRKLTDRSLRNLDSVSVTTRDDGIGTIEFNSDTLTAPESMWGSWGLGSRWSNSNRRNRNQLDIDLSSPVFYDIPDAREVRRLIQEQREKL